MITFTFTPYDITSVPRVVIFNGGSMRLYWTLLRIVLVILSTYGYSTKFVQDAVDKDKTYVIDKNKDIIMSISIEVTPTSYDKQLASSL